MTDIDREIRRLRMGNLSNESVIDEIIELRQKLEYGLERISLIESFLGIQKNDKQKTKKNTRFSGPLAEVLDIILVEKNDEVPFGYESLLIVIRPDYGKMIYMQVDDLKDFCNRIKDLPINENIPFPEYITTKKYGEKNINGEWELKEITVNEAEDETE